MGSRTLALALAGALVAGACAGDDGGLGAVAATQASLRETIEHAEDRPYRFEASTHISLHDPDEQTFDNPGPTMTGAVDGTRSSTVLDMRPAIEGDAPSEILDRDLTMTMVTDGQVLYVQAPFFRTMADAARSRGATTADLGPLGTIADLGEQAWGRVELDGLSPAEVTSALGSQSVSPDVYLELAAQGTDVSDLGTREIRGVSAHGVGAVTTYEEVLTVQGLGVDDVRETVEVGAGLSSDEAGQVYDVLLDVEIPLEVWIDGDGDVVRMQLVVDLASVRDDLAEIDADADQLEFRIDATIDMFDHGDETIVVELPETSTDVTAEYLDLTDGGGIGGSGPALPTPTVS